MSTDFDVVNASYYSINLSISSQETAGMAIAGLTGQTQQYQQMQGAVGNGSGYPVPPSGQDGYGRPYWIDPQTGQTSYEPPQSGLGLGSAIQKGAAWAKVRCAMKLYASAQLKSIS